jgi:putative transposase
MSGNPLPQHKPTRLKGYDYGKANGYFVTLCTQGRNCYFGEIQDQQICLNEWGQIADVLWQTIPNIFPKRRLRCMW